MKSDQANPKVTATLRTINNIKSSNAIMPDFLKAVQKYHQQLHALNQTSQVLSEVMSRLADAETGELRDSIRKISDTQRLIDAKRWKFATTLHEALFLSYEKSGGGQFERDKAECALFEKNYKAQRSLSMKNIKKWEKEFNKANKKKRKDQDKIKSLANTLEQNVEAHDWLLGDELRRAEMLDRRRVCFFIKQWSRVLTEEVEGMEMGMVEINKVKSELDKLTTNPDKISDTTDTLIQSSHPTKALDELKKIRETGTFFSFDRMPSAPQWLWRASLSIYL